MVLDFTIGRYNEVVNGDNVWSVLNKVGVRRMAKVIEQFRNIHLVKLMDLFDSFEELTEEDADYEEKDDELEEDNWY